MPCRYRFIAHMRPTFGDSSIPSTNSSCNVLFSSRSRCCPRVERDRFNTVETRQFTNLLSHPSVVNRPAVFGDQISFTHPLMIRSAVSFLALAQCIFWRPKERQDGLGPIV